MPAITCVFHVTCGLLGKCLLSLVARTKKGTDLSGNFVERDAQRLKRAELERFARQICPDPPADGDEDDDEGKGRANLNRKEYSWKQRAVLECKLPATDPLPNYSIPVSTIIDTVKKMRSLYEPSSREPEGYSESRSLMECVRALNQRLQKSVLGQRLYLMVCESLVLFVTAPETVRMLRLAEKNEALFNTKRAILYYCLNNGTKHDRSISKKINPRDDLGPPEVLLSRLKGAGLTPSEISHLTGQAVEQSPQVSPDIRCDQSKGPAECRIPLNFNHLLSNFREELLNLPSIIGREKMITHIMDYLATSPTQPFFTIVGGPGTGKSQLIRSVIKSRLDRSYHDCYFLIGPPGYVSVVGGFRSRHFADRTNPITILTYLAHCVGRFAEIPPREEFPANELLARRYFQDAMLRLSEKQPDSCITVFLDGLDETEGNRDHEAPLVEHLSRLEIPTQVRFVISSRPTGMLRALVGDYDIDLNTDLTQDGAIRDYLSEELVPLCPQLRDPGNVTQLVNRIESSFLYAVLLAQHARQGLDLSHPIDYLQVPDGLARFLDQEWNRLLEGPLPPPQAVKILAIVAAYRDFLTLDTLARVSGVSSAEVCRFFDVHGSLFRMICDTELATGPKSGIAGYFHSEICRHFMETKIWDSGMREAHTRIASDCILMTRRDYPAEDTEPVYCYRHLPFHLYKSHEISKLTEIVTTYHWIETKLSLVGATDLLADYALLPDSTTVTPVRKALEASVGTLHKRPHELSSQLLARLDAEMSSTLTTFLETVRPSRRAIWLQPVMAFLKHIERPVTTVLSICSTFVDYAVVDESCRMAVIVPRKKPLELWNLDTGEVLRTFTSNPTNVRMVALLPGRQLAVLGLVDGGMRLLNISDGTVKEIGRGSEDCVAIAAFPDGNTFLSLHSCGVVTCWNTEQRSVRFSLSTPEQVPRGAAQAVISGNNAAFLFPHGHLVWILDLEHHTWRAVAAQAGEVRAIVSSKDGSELVTGDQVGNVTLFNLSKKGKCHQFEAVLSGADITSLVFSPDETLIISGDSRGIVRVWSKVSGKLLHTVHTHGHFVHNLTVSAATQRLVAITLRDAHIYELDTLSSDHQPIELLQSLPVATRFLGSRSRLRCTFSDGQIREVDTSSGRDIDLIRDAFPRAARRTLSPTGRFVVEFDNREGRPIRCTDTLLGRQLPFSGDGAPLDGKEYSAAISESLMRLYYATVTGELVCCDLLTDRVNLLQSQFDFITEIAVSPNGRLMAVCDRQDRCELWDPDELVRRDCFVLPVGRDTTAVAIDDSGNVMRGSMGGEIEFFESDKSCSSSLEGHTQEVKSLRIFRNGKLGLSSSLDRMILLWDLQSRKVIASFTSDSAIRDIDVSPDGKVVAGCDLEGRILLLRLHTGV